MSKLSCLCLTLLLACAPRTVPTHAPSVPSALERDYTIERACQVVDPSVLPSCQIDNEHWRVDSRLLDSAIEAYSRREDGQAMSLLTDVIDGKGGDDGCGVQRAVYYRAKLLYRLDRPYEAFGEFVRFVQAGPSSFYYAATGRWISSLRDKLPAISIERCLDRYRQTVPHS